MKYSYQIDVNCCEKPLKILNYSLYLYLLVQAWPISARPLGGGKRQTSNANDVSFFFKPVPALFCLFIAVSEMLILFESLTIIIVFYGVDIKSCIVK